MALCQYWNGYIFSLKTKLARQFVTVSKYKRTVSSQRIEICCLSLWYPLLYWQPIITDITIWYFVLIMHKTRMLSRASSERYWILCVQTCCCSLDHICWSQQLHGLCQEGLWDRRWVLWPNEVYCTDRRLSLILYANAYWRYWFPSVLWSCLLGDRNDIQHVNLLHRFHSLAFGDLTWVFPGKTVKIWKKHC